MVLVLAAAFALAAELIARDTTPKTAVTRSAPADLDSFLAPVRATTGRSAYGGSLGSDPLTGRPSSIGPGTVAPRAGVPTVSSSGRRGRRLTAILTVDQRSIAVIDEVIVSVGDRLPDGARVDAIQNDRVTVVEKNGQRRVLTLTTGR